MDLMKKFATSRAAEIDGIRVKIGGEDGVTFVLRRAGGHNRAYRYAEARAALPYRAELLEIAAAPASAQMSDRALELEDAIRVAAFAESVVLGWEGYEVDGVPVAFSREKFLALMHACPDVWEAVKKAAFDIENFREADGKALGES